MSNFLRRNKRRHLIKASCCGCKMDYKESHDIYICNVCGKQKIIRRKPNGQG